MQELPLPPGFSMSETHPKATPPTVPPTDEGLAEMLRGDQRLRWFQGQRIPVEAYLEHYPALLASPTAVQCLLHGVRLDVFFLESAGREHGNHVAANLGEAAVHEQSLGDAVMAHAQLADAQPADERGPAG